MPFSTEQLEKIREGLPRNYGNDLAEQFRMSRKSIYRILAGKSNNDQVVMAAFEMAKEHTLKIESAKSSLAVA